MTTEEIREAFQTNRPLKVFTADNRCLEIPHPDFAMLSRSGRTLHISLKNGRTEVIDLFLIVSLQKEDVGSTPGQNEIS
jgi:hypothetical protein